MKTKTTYICEICETEYINEKAALFCEASPAFPPCPVKPGDEVKAYERYEDPADDTVIAVYIGPSTLGNVADGWEDRIDELLKRSPKIACHAWYVKLANHHQYSKDADAYTDTYRLGSIMVGGKWLLPAD